MAGALAGVERCRGVRAGCGARAGDGVGVVAAGAVRRGLGRQRPAAGPGQAGLVAGGAAGLGTWPAAAAAGHRTAAPAGTRGPAGALDSLPASRERAGDPGEAVELVRPFARAAAAVEAALFDGRGEGASGEEEAELVAAWLLFSRFSSHDQDAYVPLSVMAAA